MRTITITATHRPEYLVEVLRSLKENDCRGYELFIAIEPTPRADEIVELVKKIDWIKTHLVKNRKRLGVRKNPFLLLERVFGQNSELNVYLEDDTIVAPDTLKLANWYHETQRPGSYLCLNLLHYESRADDPRALLASKRFNSLGIVMQREAWERWFSKEWLSDERVKRVYPGKVGWDWSISSLLAEEKDLLTLTPKLSRSNHIGREGGTHATPDFHDRTFGSLAVNRDPQIEGYYIVS